MEILNVVPFTKAKGYEANICRCISDPNIFLLIGASVADAAAVNANRLETVLANGLSAIKSNPVFSNGPKSLPKNPPECSAIWNRVFDNFVLVDELFAKALQSLETSEKFLCLLFTFLCLHVFLSLCVCVYFY